MGYADLALRLVRIRETSLYFTMTFVTNRFPIPQLYTKLLRLGGFFLTPGEFSCRTRLLSSGAESLVSRGCP